MRQLLAELVRGERNILDAFERAGRSRVSKSFANNVLLALSFREAGCVLVTGNDRDFRRIRRYVAFDDVKPWPAAIGLNLC